MNKSAYALASSEKRPFVKRFHINLLAKRPFIPAKRRFTKSKRRKNLLKRRFGLGVVRWSVTKWLCEIENRGGEKWFRAYGGIFFA